MNMNNKIKMPLSVHVLFHKDNDQGKQVFEDIYHLLCRNPKEPLTDGLDIPVYLRTGGGEVPIPQIDFNQSAKNVIILLVDCEMYCCSIWKQYIEQLLAHKNENTLILPVSLFKYAFDLIPELGKTQFIALKSYSIKDNWGEFKRRIFDSLIRFFKGKVTEKLKLFISHSKKDLDRLGEVKAKELRNYLRNDTKLDSFFDANDIQDGYDFEKQIAANLENSLLIILKTNTYSEREWCRIETLLGKNNMLPTIAVSLINGEVKRNFPYLGNVPLIRYNNDWDEIVNLLLRTALNQYHQKELLDVINGIRSNGDKENHYILPFSPELFSLSLLDSDSRTVLYPEPPLGSEEIELLKRLKGEIDFITPMQVFTGLCKCLNQKKIAISISESEDISHYGGDLILLNDLIIEISRHILIAGGHLLYGGDLREQGFTEIFKDLSCQYGHLERSDNSAIYFTNYFAWPIHLALTPTQKAEFKYSRVEVQAIEAPDECPLDKITEFVSPNTIENLYLWVKSLTKMRKTVCTKANAYIILGGRTSGFIGKYPGILEEFLFAKRAKLPIFLLGGFGGVSKVISDIIMGKGDSDLSERARITPLYNDFVDFYNKKETDDQIDYDAIINEIQKEGFSNLNNGLSDDENRILFTSSNILEIIVLVMKGLNSIKNK